MAMQSGCQYNRGSRTKWIIVAAVLPLFLYAPSLHAQLRLGPQTLLHMEAPTLRNPDHLSLALKTQKFSAAVGGVAFDQIARADAGLVVQDLSLEYRPDLPDGGRLWLIVNGNKIAAPLHDWQLVPIARFADSPYYSCFTLFGQLTDSAKEKEVLERGGRILNYHPALVNTLLGLRIFQLDILIVNESADDLPKDGGRFVLGSGESVPNMKMNEIGMRVFHYYLNNVKSDLKQTHRSYVICDYGQDIRFNLHGNTLNMTGSPYYYFWIYRFDQPGYDPKAAAKKVEDQIREGMEAARKADPGGFDPRNWLIEVLLVQTREYEAGYRIYSSGTIVDLISIQEEDSRRSFLMGYATNSLYDMLFSMRADMDAHQVIHLKEYSDLVSSKPYLLRDINPAVCDAGVNTMRYSAFFRFCKRDFPEKWQKFMEQIEKAAVEPPIITPTVMLSEQKDKKNP